MPVKEKGAVFAARMAAARAAAKSRGAAGTIKKLGKTAAELAGFKTNRGHKTNSGKPKLKRLPKKVTDRYFQAAAKGDRKTMDRIAKLAEVKPRAKKKKRRRANPEDAAADRYAFFHGKDPESVTVVSESVHEHSVLSGIGKLESMTILAVDGRHVVTLKGFKGALLSQDEAGTQLFIKGGDQKVSLADFGIKKDRAHENEVLGALEEVAYFTEKRHLRPQDGGEAVYVHKFGKGGSRLPLVMYDTRNKALHLVGGGYDLPEVGIRG
jgi:hypothetical protein